MEERDQDYEEMSNEPNFSKLLDINELIKFSEKVLKYNKREYIKRKIELNLISTIIKSQHPASNQFILRIPTEYDYHFETIRREEIIEIIKDMYAYTFQENLPIYGMPTKDIFKWNHQNKQQDPLLPDNEFLLQFDNIFSEVLPNYSLIRKTIMEEYKGEEYVEDYEVPILDPENIYIPNNKNTIKLLYGGGQINYDNFTHLKELGNAKFLMQLCNKPKVIYLRTEINTSKEISDEKSKELVNELQKYSKNNYVEQIEFLYHSPGKLIILTEYQFSTGLDQLILGPNKTTELQVALYAAQCVIALCGLHQENLIYRTFKLENILKGEDGYLYLKNENIFEFIEYGEYRNNFSVSPEYAAPELIQRIGYNRMMDWWALGIIIYKLIYGFTPFYHIDKNIMENYIITKNVIFPEPEDTHITPHAKDFMTQLLTKDWRNRLGSKLDENNYILDHPFFTTNHIDKDKLVQKAHRMENLEDFVHQRQTMINPYFGSQKEVQKIRESKYAAPLHKSKTLLL